MSRITLAEFQKVTGLSDRSLGWLLKRNRLSCHLDEKRGIMVDTDCVGQAEIVRAVASSCADTFGEEEELIIERLSGIVADNLEEMCLRVLARLESGR